MPENKLSRKDEAKLFFYVRRHLGTYSKKMKTRKEERKVNYIKACVKAWVWTMRRVNTVDMLFSLTLCLFMLRATNVSSTVINPGNKPKTCIVMDVLSRSTEFEIRDWQRKEFHRQLERFSEFYRDENVEIQQRFMLGINEDDSVMKEVALEKDAHGDIGLLRVHEGYHYLTANTFDSFHQLLPLLENPSCKKSFLVRADTDFVYDYKTLSQAILAMPNDSTYFGSMMPNFPASSPLIREVGSFAQSTMPLWANGGLYGLSADVVRHLTSPEVERTVVKKEENYVFPEEDRAIGLALARSNTENVIEHYLYIKNTFHFCPSKEFTCADYGNFIGFSVGFGLSGSGKDKYNAKLKELDRISKLHDTCGDTTLTQQPSDYFFMVDDKFRNTPALDFLTYGCKTLDRNGKDLVKWVKNIQDHSMKGGEEELAADAQCAEGIYRKVFPEVNEYILNGTFTSGKEHYWNIGHQNKSMHYYCPRECNHNPNCATVLAREISNNVKSRDKEKSYLDKYPDVQRALQKGRFTSGYDHYEKLGREEGRFYGYSPYEKFVKTAIGTNKGNIHFEI